MDATRAATFPAAVALESQSCPLCGSLAASTLFEGFDRLHNLPGRFSVVRCTGCELMRTNPRPTTDTIGYYYPDNYGPYQYTRVALGEEPTQQSGWRRAVRTMMDSRSTALPDLSPGSMLEVGCASGSFLARMQRSGWKVQGVEFSPTAAKAAREAGFDVFAGSLDRAPLPKSEFDLVVAWMVLEHLHDPISSLRRLREAAKPEAVLAFSVPNAASLDFRLFRDAGYALHLPAHLFHFTPRTVRKALEASGWRLDRLMHQRTTANLIASLGHRIRDRYPHSTIGPALESFPESSGRLHDVLFPLAFVLGALGQSGRMTIWARPQ